MFRTAFVASVLFVIILFSGKILAGDGDCSVVASQAIDITAKVCDSLGRNQVCYGNSQVSVVPYGETNVTFDHPGDKIQLSTIKSLLLTPMSIPNEWGIAMLNVQANLPDTLPGQNVRMILIGNVYIENQIIPTTLLRIKATKITNLRNGPGTNFPQKGQLSAGDEITVDGRTEDKMWLRIPFDDNNIAWVYAPLINLEGNVEDLAVISPNTTIPANFKSMQAFYVQTGIGDAKCKEAAESGLIIQTPEGAGKIDFLINGVSLSVGSTIYVQSQPGGYMTIALLEGSSTVTSDGIVMSLIEGAQVSIPLDQDGLASGPPEVNSYNTNTIDVLPLSLLSTSITPAPPLTDKQLTEKLRCRAYTREAHTIGHVGPGENRGQLLELPLHEGFFVIGQALDEKGKIWYQLAPNSVSNSNRHKNIWVAKANVKPVGACRGVAEAEIPPVVLSTNTQGSGAIPLAGTWQMTVGKASSTGRCSYVPAGTPLEDTPCFGQLIKSFNRQWNVTSSTDGQTLVMNGGFPYDGVTLRRVSPTRYSGEISTIRFHIDLTPVSETEMQGVISSFSFTIPITMIRQG